MALSAVNIELTANTVKFTTGMSQAAAAARSAGSEIRGAFNTLGGIASSALAPFGQLGIVAGEAFRKLGDFAPDVIKSMKGISAGAAEFIGVGAGIAGAAAAAAAGLAALGVEGNEVVERLVLISQKTGIAVRDLQVFEAAGATVGVSLDDMVTGMRKFDQAMVGTGRNSAAAKLALHELGVTAADPKEAFLQVADSVSKMDDGFLKGSLVVALFGRSGLALIPLLNQGREGIERAREAVETYGATVTKEAIEANERWKDSSRDLNLAWDSLKVSVSNTTWLSDLKIKIADVAKELGNLIDKANETGWLERLQALATLSVDLAAGGQVNPFNAIDTIPAGLTSVKPPDPAAIAHVADDLKRQADAYGRIKDGSETAYQLEQKRFALTIAEGKHTEQGFADATKLQAEIKVLEEKEKLEKKIAAEAEKEAERRMKAAQDLAAAYAKMFSGKEIPWFSQGRPEALAKAAAEPPPDVFPADVGGQLQDVISGFAGQSGQNALKAFYAEWTDESTKTAAKVEENYRNQLAEFQGLLTLGEIGQKQFNDVSIALEEQRVRGLVDVAHKQIEAAVKLQQNLFDLQNAQILTDLAIYDENKKLIGQWDEWALKLGTVKDKTHALLNEIVLDGQDFGAKIFDSFHKAIDDVSTQLAHFVVTGKSNFKQLFQSLEESIFKASFQKLFAGIGQGIEAKLGLQIPGLGAAKADGSSASPFYVIPTDASGNILGGPGGGGILGSLFGKQSGGQGSNDGSNQGLGNIFGGGDNSGDSSGDGSGGLGDFASKISSVFSSVFSTLTSIISKIGSTIGSVFKGILGIFGGGMADGGDVMPGRAYIVGEKHPEWFVPNQRGHIAPSLEMGSRKIINMGGFHVHGVQDADSFNRSRGQIMADLQHHISVAHLRNR